MSLKFYKPTTPSQRFRVIVNKKKLWKGRAVKKLTYGLPEKAGRNNSGKITVRRRGGRHKRLYRIIDFKRTLFNIPGQVQRIEYDPNRSAFIALILYKNGLLSYILAPNELKVGDIIVSGENVEIKPGNALPLQFIPIGTNIHNIELKPGKGGQLVRAAGTSAKLIKKGEDGYALIKLSSGELRLIHLKCMATIGILSNLDHKNQSIGKAGASRWRNKRPSVRGVAMNPIDHPHGGGEGKTSGGRPSVTPWGKPTKGKRTRFNKRTQRFIVSRRK
eukprot:TRINITY_DN3294_c0_g1_i1.p1 TRINITY_DN3294_c0_g1~~TRINITY_DN3294_c0_g1_i1.p1  ORF type:complete len:275 (+),score=-145.02 TRINITY_DN3294_c0_g1_i1:208-1032(+)